MIAVVGEHVLEPVQQGGLVEPPGEGIFAETQVVDPVALAGVRLAPLTGSAQRAGPGIIARFSLSDTVDA